MKLMASYRVRNGKVPGRPTIYRMPDPCLYGHRLLFIAEIITAKEEGFGYPVHRMEVRVDEPVMLCLAMSETLKVFDEMVGEHLDWIEYRWKMLCDRGSSVGTGGGKLEE